jgi:hypothetical protein
MDKERCRKRTRLLFFPSKPCKLQSGHPLSLADLLFPILPPRLTPLPPFFHPIKQRSSLETPSETLDRQWHRCLQVSLMERRDEMVRSRSKLPLFFFFFLLDFFDLPSFLLPHPPPPLFCLLLFQAIPARARPQAARTTPMATLPRPRTATAGGPKVREKERES